jgi:hypothetical protein
MQEINVVTLMHGSELCELLSLEKNPHHSRHSKSRNMKIPKSSFYIKLGETHGEKDDFYYHIRELSRKIISEQEFIIVGDLTGKVKSKTNDRRVGQYGEGEQDDFGDRIVELCDKEDLAVVNTFFKHKFLRIMGIAY